MAQARPIDADVTLMAGPSARTQASLSDDRFRALVEDLPAVTYIADFVGAFTLRYVSPQIEQDFGYSPQRWINDETAWVEGVCIPRIATGSSPRPRRASPPRCRSTSSIG